MPCYKPLIGYIKPTKTKRGKKDITFKLEERRKGGYEFNTIEIPCGQCIGCRLDHSKEWAIRCILERKEHEENYFVTLTYNPEYIPINVRVKVDEKSGEVFEQISHTLYKKHVQDFIKRIRSSQEYKYGNKIRFYMCGEYGSEEKTMHPHYHIIFFGLHLEDLKPFFINKQKKQIYRSKYLEKEWGMGYVSIGEVNYETAAYTARYILKKQKGEMAKIYNDLNILPEYTEMSTHPGIGRNYLYKNLEKIYEVDGINIKMRKNNVIKVKPPDYFDTLREKLNPEDFDLDVEQIKEERLKKAIGTRKVLAAKTTLTRKEQLEKNERLAEERIKRLKREIFTIDK